MGVENVIAKHAGVGDNWKFVYSGDEALQGSKGRVPASPALLKRDVRVTKVSSLKG